MNIYVSTSRWTKRTKLEISQLRTTANQSYQELWEPHIHTITLGCCKGVQGFFKGWIKGHYNDYMWQYRYFAGGKIYACYHRDLASHTDIYKSDPVIHRWSIQGPPVDTWIHTTSVWQANWSGFPPVSVASVVSQIHGAKHIPGYWWSQRPTVKQHDNILTNFSMASSTPITHL